MAKNPREHESGDTRDFNAGPRAGWTGRPRKFRTRVTNTFGHGCAIPVSGVGVNERRRQGDEITFDNHDTCRERYKSIRPRVRFEFESKSRAYVISCIKNQYVFNRTLKPKITRVRMRDGFHNKTFWDFVFLSYCQESCEKLRDICSVSSITSNNCWPMSVFFLLIFSLNNVADMGW